MSGGKATHDKTNADTLAFQQKAQENEQHCAAEHIHTQQESDKDHDIEQHDAVARTLPKLEKIETDTTLVQTQQAIDTLSQDVLPAENITPDMIDEFDVEATNEQDDGGEKKRYEKAQDFVTEHKTGLIIGGVGLTAGLLLYRRIKKRREKKQQEKENENASFEKASSSSAPEKKGFRQTGFGKVLKYVGIAGGSYYGIHGLVTGKWGLSELLDWEKKIDLQDDADKVASYENDMQKHPEKKEIYEGLGNATDELYTSFFGKELASGWFDNADMETIASRITGDGSTMKGLVPWCMQKESASVEAMLGEREQSMSFLSASIEEVKEKARGMISGSGSYLRTFLVNGFDMQAAKEKFFEKFTTDPEKAAAQVKFYYREKVRVQTFLLEKKKALVEHIAHDVLHAEHPDMSDEQLQEEVADKIDDTSRMQEHVYGDTRYTSYLSGNIEHAYSVLKTAGLMNGEIDASTQETITELDAERDNMLGFDGTADVLARAKNDLWDDNALTDASKQELTGAVTAINTELQGEFAEVMQDSAWNIWKDLFNSDDQAKRKFLQESGMSAMAKTITDSLSVYSEKVRAGNITKTEMTDFVHLVNSYFAFKKEVLTGSHTLRVIHNPDGSISVKLQDFFGGQLTNLLTAGKKAQGGNFSESLTYLLSAAPLLVITGTVIYIARNPRKGMQGLGKIAVGTYNTAIKMPARILTAGSWTAKSFGGKMRGSPWALRKRFFAGEQGAEKVLSAFQDGKVSLTKAGEIFESGRNAGIVNMGQNKAVREARKRHANGSYEFKKFLIDKSFNSGGRTAAISENIDIIVKYYDAPVITHLMKQGAKGTNYAEALALMKKIDAIGFTGKKAELCTALLHHKTISQASLEKAIASLEKMDEAILHTMNSKQITTLASGLGRTPSSLDTAAKMQSHIAAIQAGEKSKKAALLAAIEEQKAQELAEKTATAEKQAAEKAAKKAENAAKRAESLWSDAKRLKITDTDVLRVHQGLVAEVKQLEASKKLHAADPVLKPLIEKNISITKNAAKHLAALSGEEAKALTSVLDDIPFNHLARLLEETKGVKGGLLQMMVDIKSEAKAAGRLIDAAGNVAVHSDDVIKVLETYAPDLLNDLKKTNQVEKFAKNIGGIVYDAAKIAKRKKVSFVVEKIMKLR